VRSRIEEWYKKQYRVGVHPSDLDRVDKVVALFSRRKANRLLDIGCGDGSLTLLLKEKVGAKEAFGIEISSEGTEVAKQKGINSFRLNVDEKDLPFDDEYFDAIFCGEIIEHLFDPDHLLKEIYRVLKLDGFSIITTPNLGAWYNRMALVLGYQPYAVTVSLEHYNVGKFYSPRPGGSEHIRFFTSRALVDLLKCHHFKIRRVVGACVSPSYYLPRDSWLSSLVLVGEKFFAKFPSLATILIVEAER
jgi:methionine biosynthesis protein MetW